MPKQRLFRRLLTALCLLLLAVLACNMPGVGDSPILTERNTDPNQISLGPEETLITQTISPNGGNISINEPDNPLNGFEIQVPPESYEAEIEFTVGHQEVLDHQLSSDFNPLTPLIHVDNGGVYANDLMRVIIPVEIPDDHFAMGIFYDPETGDITGMTPISQDSSTLTVGTRHFSYFLVTSIARQLLDRDFNTGFKPGSDDWPFTNYGSFEAPEGHCEGQTLTMLYYYYKLKDDPLHGRYDNFGSDLGKTPGTWQDDDLAYKLATVAQLSAQHARFSPNFLINLQKGTSPELTFFTFAYMFLLTGEPQEVAIYNEESGHAMVAYAKKKNTLHIADPNYPGEERKIEFDARSKTFKPYNSGPNAKELGISFPYIYYLDKWGILSEATLASLWSQLENGTIGDGVFTEYTLNVQESTSYGLTAKTKLINGYQTSEKTIYPSIDFEFYPRVTVFVFQDDGSLGLCMVPPISGGLVQSRKTKRRKQNNKR